MKSAVAVLIVNYRSSELVATCVSSLAHEEDIHIYIVDNSNDDTEFAMITDHVHTEHPSSVFKAPANLGFGAGVNYLVRQLDLGQYSGLLLINPDTTASQGSVAALRRSAAQNPNAIIAPLITTSAGAAEVVWFAGGEVDTRRGVVRHIGYGDDPALHVNPLNPQGFLSGAAMYIPVEVWKRVGPFREDLFLYWEDVEYSLRAIAQGVSLVVAPDARVWHAEGGTSGGGDGHMSTLYYRYTARNRIVVIGGIHGVWNATIGTGAGQTIKGIFRPFQRRERGGVYKSLHALAGTAAGVVEVLKSRRHREHR